MQFEGVVYVPEYKNGIQYDFLNQAEWERDALMGAGIILFYLCRQFPEIPGMTTNVEFGTYMERKKESIILCSPPGCNKNRYLEWLFVREKPNEIIYRDINDALKAAIRKLKLIHT